MQQTKWPLKAFDLSQSIELIFNFVTDGFRQKTPMEIKIERDKKIAQVKKRNEKSREPEDDYIILTESQVRYLYEAPLAELEMNLKVARCYAALQSYDTVIDEACSLLENHLENNSPG